MKIVMLCGSPRPKGSNSLYLLEKCKEKLESANEILLLEASRTKLPELTGLLLEQLHSCDALVVAFPLYVDGIPSSLLGILESLQHNPGSRQASLRVYTIVNCGFYEASQTRNAIRMLWKWCEKCGFQKGSAVAVGAGEMSKVAPIGQGPAKNLGKALDTLAADIQAQKEGGLISVEPNFPRFLYKLAAHMGWRSAARKNNVKLVDVKRKIPQEN